MNYLAHLLLAGPDPGMRLGGLIGDFMSGMAVSEFAPHIQAGIHHHRRIDRFTDAHPVFRRSRSRCPAPLSRFAGVIIDVAYDHLLASRWDHWHPEQDLSSFSAEVYALLESHSSDLPPLLARARTWIIGEDWLGRYAEPSHLDRVFAGMSRRIRRDNPLAEAGEFVRLTAGDLELDFQEFFPSLRAVLTT